MSNKKYRIKLSEAERTELSELVNVGKGAARRITQA